MGRRYLLVCRGPNCKAQGSAEVREMLQHAIANAPIGDDDVRVLPYTCFDRCGRGPNAVLYPDGVWYEALEIDDVSDVARHALGGTIPTHLLAAVDHDHAQACYRLFDEMIPELEREEKRPYKPRRRRWWPF